MEDNADREHERLWSIAGEWATDGHVVGDPPLPVKGSDTYEVLPGGYFLVHHVDVTVGDRQVRAIEVIGEPAPDVGGFLARSFDDQGNAEVMRVTVDDEGVFHFTGGPEIASAAQAGRHDDRSSALDPDGGARSSVDDGVVGTLRGRPQLGAMDAHHVHPAMTAVRPARVGRGRWSVGVPAPQPTFGRPRGPDRRADRGGRWRRIGDYSPSFAHRVPAPTGERLARNSVGVSARAIGCCRCSRGLRTTNDRRLELRCRDVEWLGSRWGTRQNDVHQPSQNECGRGLRR